jgi:alpha-galactosidase
MRTITCALLLLRAARALVTLPPHLSSGAVLQTWRGSHTATHLYGTASPGETVAIATSVKGVPAYITTTSAFGAWAVDYNWPPGPTCWDDFDINVTGSSAPDAPIQLKGVRWGDVVFCVGDASALLPAVLSDGGAAWLANASHALSYVRLFPASVRGSCGWGGETAGPPCDTWTNASAAVGAGFSASCLLTAVEATRARGFGGNSVVGLIVLAANESAIEDWLPPVGVSAVAACAPLAGAPPSLGALWAAAGAPFAEFPARYFSLALGASDAARVAAAITSTGDAPAVADAYGCRVRALIAGLRAGPAVGDSVVLLLEPGPGAAQPDAADGHWALRAGLALALPGALPGVGSSTTTTALVSSIDAGDGAAVNTGGARASTAVRGAAVRGGAALAHVAWWSFQVPDLGPRATAARSDADGSAVVSFAFAPDASANASTLALVPAPGCVACCASASANFQVAPASAGPWTPVAPTLSLDHFSLRLPPSGGSARWVRVGAGDPASPQCFLVDANSRLPAFAFALQVSGAAPRRVDARPRRRAHTAGPRESPPPLPHAAAPLAPGTAPRREYLLAAAVRAARVAATPVSERYAGLAALPPRYFNTWQAFRCNLDEGLMLSAGRVLVESGLAAAGFTSVNSDDCEWRTARDNSTGAVVADETRWPNGFAALAAALDALAVPLGLGVYTSQTANTCVGRPASYEHEEIDAATWCAWGATTLKVDNCGGARYAASNTSWIKLRAALDACPHEVLLAVESCGVPAGGSGANPSCAEWIRSTGVQMFRTTADLQLYWQSAMFNLDGNEPMAPLAGPGVWADPDMTIVGHGILSAAEEQSHWSAWVIAAAPLGLAFDLTRGVPNATLALISAPEVLALHADPAGVAGVRATPANPTGAECWAKPLANGGGNATAVLLFNRGNATADVTCAWADVAPHWPADTRARVRDVYARADVGVFRGGFTARALETHASLLVVATPE